MGGHLDTTVELERARLCKLGNVPRGKHIRWGAAKLLAEKPHYDELDLIEAVVLDQLTRTVKPQLAQAAWRQIRPSLDPEAPRIEVVLSTGTKRAFLINEALQLDQVLPRDEAVIVVELTSRIREARTRLADYRASDQGPPRPERNLAIERGTVSEAG
jgi:hypothetical protein